jgi:hypothetical protein
LLRRAISGSAAGFDGRRRFGALKADSGDFDHFASVAVDAVVVPRCSTVAARAGVAGIDRRVVVDGVYDLVEWRVYGPLTEQQRQTSRRTTSWIFNGGTRYENVSESENGLSRTAGTLEAQGTVLYATRFCSPPDQNTREGALFTASGAELFTFSGTNPEQTVQVQVARRR